MAPTGDEFHTLTHLDHRSIGAFWESYRAVGDTLPPVGYVISWSLADLTGGGIVGVRMPMVLSWAFGTGVVAYVCRGWGPCGALVGGLMPSASMMLFVGAFARPYAMVFAAFAVAVAAWQRSFEPDGRRIGLAPAVLAVSLSVAVVLHYAAGAVVVAIVVAELLVRRDRLVLIALSAGLLPLALSLPLVPSAADNHGRIPHNATLDQVPRFHVSVWRPLWPAVLLVGLVTVVAVVILHARGGRLRLPSASDVTAEPLVVLGLSLVLVVPVLTLLGMSATSGVYLHRYAIGAVIGAALLVARATAWLGERSAPLARAAVLVVLVSVPLATVRIGQERLPLDDAQELAAELALPDTPGPIVVLDNLTFRLLETYSSAEVVDRLRLGASPVYAGTFSEVVDWRVQLDDLDESGPLHLVGPSYLQELPSTSDRSWTVDTIATARVPTPEGDRTVVHRRLVRPGA